MHTYRCAECGKTFKTDAHADRCPQCRCKILIHVEGSARKRRGGCGGSCSPGCSCGHCH